MGKIIDIGKEADEQERKGMGSLFGLLNPKNLAKLTKEVSQKAMESMAEKKVLITKISNGFICDFISVKVVKKFYRELKELEPDVRLFLR